MKVDVGKLRGGSRYDMYWADWDGLIEENVLCLGFMFRDTSGIGPLIEHIGVKFGDNSDFWYPVSEAKNRFYFTNTKDFIPDDLFKIE